MGNDEIDDGDMSGVHELRSFGRRRGRKLSPRQERLMAELLPRVRPRLGESCPCELAALFTDPVREVWIEIGFGGGEHLLWQARNNADAGIIGAEPFEDGIVKVLAGIQDEQLGNVLVHPDDVRALLRWLPPASVAKTFILFPDPWPKRRHAKRRLVARSLLEMLARVMRPGAELRVATDIGDYARTMLMAFQASPEFHWLADEAEDWRVRPADWPSTRYEAKAVREGRRSCYLRFRRV
jgi:tRNA (guanine-N7-)-methyltransferase